MSGSEPSLYPSQARTATPTPSVMPTLGRLRMHVVIDVTAVVGTPSVTPAIDGYDTLSGKWYNLLTGLPIVATGTTVLKIGPGLTPIPNACAADMLPATLRLTMEHADSDSITYSAAAHLAP